MFSGCTRVLKVSGLCPLPSKLLREMPARHTLTIFISNHGSFAANQLAAIAIVEANPGDAKAALDSYFNGPFKDQIAATGEQPYEAVRTRPFHYRCFNLEAMIVSYSRLRKVYS